MFSSELLQNLPQKLAEIITGSPWLFAEILLAFGFLGVIALDILFKERAKHWLYFFSLIGFIGVICAFVATPIQEEKVFFLGLLRLSYSIWIFKILIISCSILTLLILPQSGFLKSKTLPRGEFYALLWSVTLGLCLLVMSANLLMIYISLELVSISSYLLASFGLNRQSAEGGIKYLLIGALSSGIMLYGMSLLYGFTGTLDFVGEDFAIGIAQANNTALGLALLFSLGGLLFKISIVPFHIWIPDVYEASPTPIVAFFSTAPKIAALFLLYEFTRLGFTLPSGLFKGEITLAEVFALLAIATITLGNFSALWQTNLKRLLAYSSIAQAGFMMILLVVDSELGLKSFIFYSIVYLLTNFGAFLLVEMYAEGSGQKEDLKNLQGLGRIKPLPAILFTVLAISLVGLPPMAGFTAKLLIFSALWEAYLLTSSPLLMFLFVYGLLNAAVSLFYYLKIPYYLFMKEKEGENNELIFQYYDQVLLILLVTPVIVLFFRPDLILDFLQFII
jgi:NADH-quinone oxidoreductase subunit N